MSVLAVFLPVSSFAQTPLQSNPDSNAGSILSNPASLLHNTDLPLIRELTPNAQSKNRLPDIPLTPHSDSDKKIDINALPENLSEETIEPRSNSFVLNEIALEGVTVFKEKDLKEILTRWIGKTVGFFELKQIADDIDKLYKSQGYITSRAVIPPQQVTDGRVFIEVVEGKIGKIQLLNNKYLRDRYVLKRISQKEGDVFKLSILEQDAIQLNREPLIEKAKVTLEPGELPGTSDIILDIKDRRPYHLALSSDNQGRELIGLYKSNLLLSHENLLGFGDQFASSLTMSTDFRTIAQFFQYKFPLNKWGWKMGAYRTGSHVRIGGDLAPVDITGDSDQTSIFTEMPIYNSNRWKVNTSAALNFYNSTISIGGILLKEFTKESFDIVRTLNFGLNITEQDKTGRWSFQASMENGIDWLGGNTCFVKFNSDIIRLQSLGKGFVLVLRGQGQTSPQNLAGMMQYQIGGATSVRGFREGVFIGDHGYMASGELRIPLLGMPQKIHDNWQALIYIDHGRTFLSSPSEGEAPRGNPGYLTGYGFGLRGRLTKYLETRIDFGMIAGPGEGEPDMRIHFALTSQIF